MIPYGRQDIDKNDIDSVINVLKSDFLTQGPQTPLFEDSVRKAVNADFAVAVNSATSALHIACLALGVSKGDIVWTTPITFVASANCALYCGAEVDFIDIDPETYNLSIKNLEQKLIDTKANNLPLPKVLIPVHLSGQSCEMDKIYTLGKKYGFSIIEDASHAIGGKYQGKPIGNCKYSDITIFSFHPVKVITTGEGGVATTNDSQLSKKMNLLRSHGITRNPDFMTEKNHGDWYYQQIDLGFNYRMTEIQAGLGVSQMTRLNEFVAKRNKLAIRYNNLLQRLPITIQKQLDDAYSARHLYIIRLSLDKIALSHKEVFERLRKKGVGVNLHYIPVHTQPYYQQLGFKLGQFIESEKYYQEAISLPLFPAMTKSDQDKVVQSLEYLLK